MKLLGVIFSLLILFSVVTAAKVDTLQIYSTKMDTALGAIVIVPDDISGGGALRFPTVYLLHGWSGNFTNWFTKTDLKTYADAYNFIIVCPEGGYAGWYLDSPINPKSQFESYIIQDVVPYIDSHYPTLKDYRRRAICGLSMGGHGALFLFIRHPDVFGVAGSMSGVLELDQSTARYSIAKLLGEYTQFADRWQDYSVLSLLSQIQTKNHALLIDCGVEDRFIVSNRKAHQYLLTQQIPHTYIERPGGHTWAYWTSALPYHLLFFQQYFNRTPIDW